MSVGIVRVQKMTARSVKGIQIHDRREKDGLSHSNKDIDWERSRQNYDLHPDQNGNFNQAVKERINQLNLRKAVRKDAIVMAQVLVTSEHEFFERLSIEQQEKFFKDSYRYLADRYGKENIISSTVHLDEYTPHMHFNFVPVTEDGRLSAKSILTRKSLIEQQTSFYEQVGKSHGLERGMTKEQRIAKGVQRKDYNIHEFKALTKQKEIELAELEAKVRNATEVASKAEERASKALEQANVVEDSIKPVQAEYEAKKAYIAECDKASEISKELPSYAKKKKNLLGVETVTVPLEEWKQKCISENEKLYCKRAIDVFERKVEEFKNTSSAKYVKELEGKIRHLEERLSSQNQKNKNLIDDNRSLKCKSEKDYEKVSNLIDRMNKVLNKFPDDIRKEFVKEWNNQKTIEKEFSHDHDMER